MEVIRTAIDGVVIIEPHIFRDSRGYFFESYMQREFDEKVRQVNFIQDNESKQPYHLNHTAYCAGCISNGLHLHNPNWCASLKEQYWMLLSTFVVVLPLSVNMWLSNLPKIITVNFLFREDLLMASRYLLMR